MPKRSQARPGRGALGRMARYIGGVSVGQAGQRTAIEERGGTEASYGGVASQTARRCSGLKAITILCHR